MRESHVRPLLALETYRARRLWGFFRGLLGLIFANIRPTSFRNLVYAYGIPSGNRTGSELSKADRL